MNAPTVFDSAKPIDRVLALVAARLPAAQQEVVARYVREYLARLDPDDLAERDPADLYGAALSHWNLAQRREAGTPRVRVLNPRIEEQGWQSTHTVVEIVNDDMPFLVDSVTMEINRHGLALHLIIHPTLSVARDASGHVVGVAPLSAPLPEGKAESWIHVECDRVADPAQLEQLRVDLLRVLADVRASVADWKAMLAKLREVATELERQPPSLPPAEVAESVAFLNWLADDHFTLLGYRMQDLVSADGADALRMVPGSGLGLLKDTPGAPAPVPVPLPEYARAIARSPQPLVVTKANARSTVHRPGYLDYIGVKRFDASGNVVGEHRFLGLYTSSAYNDSPEHIPLLRVKTANVVARTGFAPGGHAGKSLRQILQSYPRDELFQIGEDELLATATGILQLGERQRFRLFVRRDPFERFVACLIFAPQRSYNTDVRRKWQAILQRVFGGTGSEFDVSFSESMLARVLITVHTTPGRIPAYDAKAIEAELAAVARSWDDDLRAALLEKFGEARGLELARTYGGAFSAGYRDDFSARNAIADIEAVLTLAGPGAVAMNLYRPLEAAPGTLRFKLYSSGSPAALSDSLPMLEHMGLRVIEERPYRVQPQEAGQPVWIDDFGLATAGEAVELDLDALGPLFEDAFARVFRGEVDNDDFNRLVLSARLSADEIVLLRAYARYMRQIGFPLSQAFVEATLTAHPDIARMLVRLFDLRLNPTTADEATATRQEGAIVAELDKVANLNEDRVLRQMLALVLATLRTNFWRRDAAGKRRPFVSFKLDPSKVPGMPEPRPMFEIFVYSPRFEGVHLRGGRVARGGLRWSDRPEDFRTEVLGLVKAQMVKNSVIVPVGSKGGFVLKRPPPATDRDATMKEGIACYQDYLRGLLDLTDNRVGTGIVPPQDVKRRDGDDPYLVVAADKGTATFSDFANAISAEYGFWLGDAFASGGSVGYDHKAMGITARGAWESVKRHFRELGIDTQATDFSVVGIGDMSGDVFGNGMLLSPHIRLVAAFDHRHVFLDPSPDTAKSFAERERLFKLPRSSWADYNTELISRGGGVWPRSAKSIPLSAETRAVLGVEAEALAPTDLISAILRAPVDLLYNGGIGTYVKASDETHAQVGDRANDGLRIDGRELRARVVGEGGNLGFTQRGRIEYSRAGGRIYTDAIDNSAGVDTSDHEVNLKILAGLAIAEGELTAKQRNAVLAQMTDDVARLVLRDNYFQTQALSIAERIAPQLLDADARFMRFLERAGRLHRAIEFLPDEDEIATRAKAKQGLVRPERAVLLAYSKMWLYDELLDSTLLDDPWIATALERYFPPLARERFAPYLGRHPLKREIIATHVVNSMVNRVGSTFVHRLVELTGAKPSDVVRAYLLTREIFGFVPLWQAIESLDNRVADATQASMLLELRRLIERATTWFLRSRRLGEPLGETMARFSRSVEALVERLPQWIDADATRAIDAQVAALESAGVPQAVAKRVALADLSYAALDIIELAGATGREAEAVAAVYFDLESRLSLAWLRQRIAALPAEGHWQTLARSAMRDDLASLHRELTLQTFSGAEGGQDRAQLTNAWEARNEQGVARARTLLKELRAAENPDASMLAVLLRELRGLA